MHFLPTPVRRSVASCNGNPPKRELTNIHEVQADHMKADTMIVGPPAFPVETWETIFRNVTRPGDLYNVSLTARYFYNVVTPILYQKIFLDPNPYLIYTLALFKRKDVLKNRVTELTLLPTVSRVVPSDLRAEAGILSQNLYTPPMPMSPPLHSLAYPGDHVGSDTCFQPLLHFLPAFASLTTLHIVQDDLPSHFLRLVYDLPQLATLHLYDSLVSASLEMEIPCRPLLLRNLSITGCRTKADATVLYIPGILCEGLIKHSPLLSSLTVDLFVEYAACEVLAGLENPPPIRTFRCHGMTHQDPNCILLCSVLSALPTITSLYMTRTPRELVPILPSTCLPNLNKLTGQIKSVSTFIVMNRPLQYLTITDAPASAGGTPWETQLIQFLESLKNFGMDLKGLAFNVTEWSEEIFLCVCQLWPGIRKLKIQCTRGQGVDEHFRISFGPRFLPQLQALEVLHIYEKSLKHDFTEYQMLKGVPVSVCSPPSLSTLDPQEAEELAEAPVHLRRWEKIAPCLQEVAFDREAWWRRLEPGGWVLKRNALPALAEDSG